MDALEALLIMYLGYTFGIPILGVMLIAVGSMLTIAKRFSPGAGGQIRKSAMTLSSIGFLLVVGSAVYFFVLTQIGN